MARHEGAELVLQQPIHRLGVLLDAGVSDVLQDYLPAPEDMVTGEQIALAVTRHEEVHVPVAVAIGLDCRDLEVPTSKRLVVRQFEIDIAGFPLEFAGVEAKGLRPRQANRVLVAGPHSGSGAFGDPDLQMVSQPPPHEGKRSRVVSVIVRDEKAGDVVWIETVGFDIRKYAITTIEAGINQPELLARVDHVTVAVQLVRQVVAVVSSTDDVHVLIDLHLVVNSSGIE